MSRNDHSNSVTTNHEGANAIKQKTVQQHDHTAELSSPCFTARHEDIPQGQLFHTTNSIETVSLVEDLIRSSTGSGLYLDLFNTRNAIHGVCLSSKTGNSISEVERRLVRRLDDRSMMENSASSVYGSMYTDTQSSIQPYLNGLKNSNLPIPIGHVHDNPSINSLPTISIDNIKNSSIICNVNPSNNTHPPSSSSIFSSQAWAPRMLDPVTANFDPKEVFQSSASGAEPQRQRQQQPDESVHSTNQKPPGSKFDFGAMFESQLSGVPPTTRSINKTISMKSSPIDSTFGNIFPSKKQSSTALTGNQSPQKQAVPPFHCNISENLNVTHDIKERTSSSQHNATTRIDETQSVSVIAASDLDAVLALKQLCNSGSALRNSSPGEMLTVNCQNIESLKENKKPTRKRFRQRKNYDPTNKIYVTPTHHDVLLGRGGRTNHHRGNNMYLEAKEEIQDRYMGASKDEKTVISQELVDIVHNWGGRFLKLDESSKTADQWFEVPNIIARKKASQSLREVNTPEERAAKRAKYISLKPRKELE
jgi:hypothetical protein